MVIERKNILAMGIWIIMVIMALIEDLLACRGHSNQKDDYG